ncbi:hypothetical protein [Lignipirellula cremea]|uniref:Uncharacterized protein n=1 Tax=Lignipirellula cremea TaxID=2528010 RepID=A0A518DNI3_9BACT|nr:hypothetical protein [Lignipirellula cremea]QDU93395.1 hypothetical protein Pla8534_11750 [Lignipirellula cremea]
MLDPDLFVGAVAIGVGVWALWSAFANLNSAFQLHKAQWLESLVGRMGARLVYAIVGLGLIALGVAIAMGFGPNKSPSAGSRENGRPLHDVSLLLPLL